VKRISIILLFCLLVSNGGAAQYVLHCSVSNDLFRILKSSGRPCVRAETALAAVQTAQAGDAVLILADDYPAQRVRIDPEVHELAETKKLSLYIEYPESLPGFISEAPRKTTWERGIVSADVFGPELPPLTILANHDCHFLPAKAEKPWLVVGRVAGFDRAVYGIPTNAYAILFEIPERRAIVATTKLSGFVTARYAPMEHWLAIWEKILGTLLPSNAAPKLEAAPLARPAYGPKERLPRDFELRAFSAASDWLLKARLLIAPERTNAIYSALARNQETLPLADSDAAGDGSLGILEGYSSEILHTGDQLQRLPLRADCHAEAAAVLALNDRNGKQVASNLLDYVYFTSGMCRGPRADARHGAFGLIGWGDISPTWLVANYGDDNARAIQGTILAAAALNTEKWNASLAKALIANLRTTGKLGFRGDRIDNPALASGWKQFYHASPVNYSPHFESGLWACYLWAYRATGYEPFLARATNAVGMTMKVYPEGWRLGDNIERARMLLCLAWLVRVADTPRHRDWLFAVARDLLKRQQPSGAIHEWLAGTGGGHYQIPQSNEAYGTAETPLIQQNGDPASDQLYTTGFALFGLHEAAAATSDSQLRQAADKLAEFLCRIQIRSKEKPWLDGWWFRAFDDRRWEYRASSADIGWGAWSLEAGWAQAWTAIALALRERNTTFWDLTEGVQIRDEFNKWKPRMLDLK
jgi:hypothetical protein